MDKILEIAKNYQRRGWQPIPIAHRSKNPNLSGWQNFQTVEAELPNHFNGKPQNIGVLLGAKSGGLTDIDLDSPEAVKIADYFLPETNAVFGRAGKPRSHRLYISDFPKIEKFEAGETIVEIRSTGGQTVFPGSTHPGGETIEWQSDGEPCRIEARHLRQAVARLACACLISKSWRSGTRNEMNLSLSGALLRNGFDLAETKHFIRAVCAAANDEEISDRLKTIDATAKKLQNGEKIYGLPRLAELTDKKLVETICKWLEIKHRGDDYAEQENPNREASTDFDSLPRPLDLVLKPVETIDDDCLPDVLVDWLRPASKVIGCPFDFLVLSAVVMVGSLIGSRLRVKPLQNSDWFVVPNLYGGCVGLPSTKKTPALDETRKPILELQAAARKEFSDKEKDFAIEAKFYERETTAVYREKLGLEETKIKIKELPEPDEPIMRRFETNDITTPKLAQFLAENPNGLLQTRDELVGWLKSLEADYDLNARSFILELWKGAIAYTQARVGSGEIQIQSGTLSIIGGIQPSKLQHYIAEAYSFDNSDGLPQRFLFAYPDVNKRSEKPNKIEYRAMQKGFNKINELCGKLAAYDFRGKVIGANGDHFHIVKFNDAAQSAVDEWNADIEAEAESLQTEDEAFSSYLYKLPKSCFAVALIFHCLEHLNQPEFPDDITEKTTLKAINYIEVLKLHARRVFALGENQTFALANTLLGKIKKGDLKQGFTAREVMRKHWSGLKSKDAVQDVLSLLIDYAYLREAQTEGEGRRTVEYFYHPSLEKEIENEVEE